VLLPGRAQYRVRGLPLDIDDHVLRQAKQVAAREGKTLTRVVEEALRERVAAPRRAAVSASAADQEGAPDSGRQSGRPRRSVRGYGGSQLIAVDTNILVYTHREELPQHAAARARLTALAEGDAPWAIPRVAGNAGHGTLGIAVRGRLV
jgi:hypothetical protein